MPVREMSRDQDWMFPPRLEELLPADHPARFVAMVVDELVQDEWGKMGVSLAGDPLGAPSYHPRALLCVWLYGFMTGVRSSRRLENACHDQIPYLWLTAWAHPDHNTLWRFYSAHREQMRVLFKKTIKTAVRLDLLDLVVQAVDGTKVAGNAARTRTYDAEGLKRLLERVEAKIADLEAQNTTGGDPPPARLPQRLAEAKRLEEQVREAMEALRTEENGPKHRNLTDQDAHLMKSPQGGYVAGFNAQAMVSGLNPKTAGATGLFITAAEVSTSPADQDQLHSMITQAAENTGEDAEVTLADGGYHSGENVARCTEEGRTVLMPESGRRKGAEADPYRKEAFSYDEPTDTYTCPQGKPLHFYRTKRRKGHPISRIYHASKEICRACPAFGTCTKDRKQGRTLEIGPNEQALRQHRALMATEQAKTIYRRRKQLPEPVFGILKELQGARRFLLRGVDKVRAEWTLLATAFNLRTLYRIWAGSGSLRGARGLAI